MNRGDWPPKVACEFHVPAHDGRICQSYIQQGEEPGVVMYRAACRARHRLGDPIPMAWRRHRAGAICPKVGNLRLLRRAGDTIVRPERSDFLEIAGILGSPASEETPAGTATRSQCQTASLSPTAATMPA